jgi:Icc protein
MIEDPIDDSSQFELLVQISDTHLCSDPGRSLRGINTQECFKAVLEYASDHLAEANHIVITGDISHDESYESYSFISQELKNYKGTKSFLPGNHDDVELIFKVTSCSPWPTLDEVGSWSIIGLNTQVEGKSEGYLDLEQLKRLRELLSQNTHRNILLALHHPPVSLGSEWMDNISLKNQTEFRSLVSDYKQVKAVVFGHAHQEADKVYNDVRWLCCPSTCVQFLPNTETAYSDERLPGYRWLRLYKNGSLETGVERIAEWPPGNGPDRRKWT